MSLNATKSNSKAEALRRKACQMMENGHLYEALLKLNKSLCLTERCTRTVGMVYANRAELYFKLKLYDKCLNNIQLAGYESCPKDKIALLREIEDECLARVVDGEIYAENPWEFFKLSYPSNPKLPHVIDCIEVKCDKKFGRYLITNQALNVGDIIAIEKPFFKIIKTDPDDEEEYPETNIYQYCANCLDDNLMDLIPCSFCLTTMFCSSDCLTSASKSFHQYECPILLELNETANWRMPLRNFFHALSICGGSVEELERLMKESDEVSPTVFNFDFCDPKNLENAKNQLRCMISLERKIEVNVKDFSSIFLQTPKLSELWTAHSHFINKFLERMMQVEILNFHGIKGRSLNRNNTFRSCLGDGGYIFCSLINHSCCPNTMRIVVQNRMVLVVERPVKKGEQLFDCYIG